ncbi:MAG: alpha/beta hydrolase [Anaerolineae bacterium]|nr:alpha/beta hydrolase [Anaerolineae bacterium]
MRKWLVVVMGLLAMSLPAAAQNAAIEPFDCPFFISGASCGYLIVPEDRSAGAADATTIKIAYVVIKSSSDHPQPDPMVYLVGGPGGSALSRARATLTEFLAPFVRDRDLILVDQRGTGLSQPNLGCREYREQTTTLFEADTAPEQAAAMIELTLACHDRLKADGANMAAYTSAANAADLDDLRQALGYDEWNLLGISYGTRLALTMMRDQPEGIRSVILDSVYPPQSNLYTSLIDNAERAQTMLFAACAADPDCDATYPHLEAVFWEVYQQLNKEPLVISINSPVLGAFNVVINGNRFYNWVFNWLYHVPTLVNTPRFIYDLKRGDTASVIGPGIESELNTLFVSTGMYYSVQCSEEVAFTHESDFDDMLTRHPRLRPYITAQPSLGANLLQLCAGWDTYPALDVENEAVVSDIPTLVLAGEFDPITPPAWAQMTAETLSHSYYYEVPAVGHGTVTSSTCARSMALAFVDDPTQAPESDCLAEISGLRFITRSTA